VKLDKFIKVAREELAKNEGETITVNKFIVEKLLYLVERQTKVSRLVKKYFDVEI
jgi:hypothetical protein